MDGAESSALAGIFAAAIQLADDVAPAATPGIDGETAGAIGFSISRQLRELHDRLERVPSIDGIPPDVLEHLKTLARIVRGTRTDCIAYGDMALYLARSDMRAVAREGWQSLIRSRPKNQGLMAWADDGTSTLTAEGNSAGGIGPTVDAPAARLLNPDISDAISDADAAAYRPGESSPSIGDAQPADEERLDRDQAMRRLLSVFTGGMTDDKFRRAADSLLDKNLNTNEKLTKLDADLRLPAKASAEQLGRLVGVSKQAVLKTDWWIQHRKGEKGDEVGRRHQQHVERAKQYEPSQPSDDDE